MNISEPASPVYRRIESDMRQKIAEGVWPPGIMVPSRKSLSKSYGVDLRTVQRAIAALLEDGTLKAESGRGTFVPNQSTSDRRLSDWFTAQASVNVGLVMHRFYSPTAPGTRATSKAVYDTILRDSPHVRLLSFDTYSDSVEQIGRLERDAFKMIEEVGFAGAIISQSGGEQTELQLRQMIENGLPVVLIDRFLENCNCDFVGADNIYGAREAVEYLIGLGHRRIGLLAPDEPITSIEERLKGYHAALHHAGIQPMPQIEFRPSLRESVSVAELDIYLRRVVSQIKQMVAPPTAIFAVNDFQAHHLINALSSANLSTPRDISIIGFDDIDRYSPRTPMLTTMRQAFDSIGERAVDLLLKRIEESKSPTVAGKIRSYQHVLLTSTLVIRDSCRRIDAE